MTEATMTPVESIKVVISAVGDLSSLVSDVTQGISFSDVAKLIQVAGDVPGVLKNAQAAYDQYLALDDESRAALIDYVAQNVTFAESVTVQQGIQLVLDAAIAFSKVLQAFGG